MGESPSYSSPRRHCEYYNPIGRETVRPIPDYFKRGRFHGNPTAKNQIPDERDVIQMAV